MALLHCIDHVVASSQRIKKANDSLKSNPELEVPRDQGFTRPKVCFPEDYFWGRLLSGWRCCVSSRRSDLGSLFVGTALAKNFSGVASKIELGGRESRPAHRTSFKHS